MRDRCKVKHAKDTKADDRSTYARQDIASRIRGQLYGTMSLRWSRRELLISGRHATFLTKTNRVLAVGHVSFGLLFLFEPTNSLHVTLYLQQYFPLIFRDGNGYAYGILKGNKRGPTYHELVWLYSRHFNQFDCVMNLVCINFRKG